MIEEMAGLAVALRVNHAESKEVSVALAGCWSTLFNTITIKQ